MYTINRLKFTNILILHSHYPSGVVNISVPNYTYTSLKPIQNTVPTTNQYSTDLGLK
ncbi:hypothetical protein NADFUDRAFT_82626 [Nadsonia fulvescens var. elongata DSM 6958]|uniref:Uncharacterized protein n=1 Tax=Nadsonia fulvescens var. elongata DSM 6958 TaxID=857566 RepID=A0A1E3PJT2_9ASCO|nr:hypothetical protein NADFUDRAFT_82626 [Nadsonia fulvescens var. elongata DSM 6958]